MNRYIIGFLAFVGLVILLFVLLFSHGPKKSTPTPLPNYASSAAELRLVVNGPIVAPQNHNSVQIDVSQYSTDMNIYQGYDGQVVNSYTFNNSENSFRSFLYALYYAGFMDGASSKYKGSIGICPTGDTYDLYLYNNGQTVEHYWATSCAGDPATYSGDLGLTMTLFEKQVPNINQLTSNLNI